MGSTARTPSGTPQRFGRTLRAWRRDHALPMKSLAHDLGFAVSTLSAWETGARFPSPDNLLILSQHTGIPPCLIAWTENESCPCMRTCRRIPHTV